jgi:hypothetical protein
LDQGDLGGTLQWQPPASDSEVTHYLVYMAEDTTGGCTDTRAPVLASVSGSLIVQTGASDAQVQADIKTTIAKMLSISANSLTVDVNKVTTRRLLLEILEHEDVQSRQLGQGNFWAVSFSAFVPSQLAEQFVDTAKTALEEAISVDYDSLTVASFGPITVADDGSADGCVNFQHGVACFLASMVWASTL